MEVLERKNSGLDSVWLEKTISARRVRKGLWVGEILSQNRNEEREKKMIEKKSQ
jgi:hypothetical protein